MNKAISTHRGVPIKCAHWAYIIILNDLGLKAKGFDSIVTHQTAQLRETVLYNDTQYIRHTKAEQITRKDMDTFPDMSLDMYSFNIGTLFI